MLIRRWQGAGVNDLIGLSIPNSRLLLRGIRCRSGADLSELSLRREVGEVALTVSSKSIFFFGTSAPVNHEDHLESGHAATPADGQGCIELRARG